MGSNNIRIRSPFAPEVCISRISSALHKEEGFWPDTSHGFDEKPRISGLVTESSVRLWRRINYRNSFQTYLNAEVRPDGVGSILVGSFGMHPFVKGFMGCWFVGVFCFGGIAGIAALAGLATSRHAPTNHSDNHWMLITNPPLMMVFGIVLLCLGRHFARNDKRIITEFLVRTLSVGNNFPEPDQPAD